MLFDLNKLKHLDLRRSNINDEHLDKLGDVIGSSDKIDNLCISSNENITDEGLNKLINHMLGNTSLKTLDISNNRKITEKSIPLLLEMAEVTSITSLHIYGTGIDYDKTNKVYDAFKKPVNDRNIPLKSKTKSAAKVR